MNNKDIINSLNDSLENLHVAFIDGVGDFYAVSEETIRNALALLKEQEAKPLQCKECSYHRKDSWCNEHGREVNDTDYCSFGAWKGQ